MRGTHTGYKKDIEASAELKKQRADKARRHGKSCGNCLWNWEDLHNAGSGTRMCYSQESAFYHMARGRYSIICKAYEAKAK